MSRSIIVSLTPLMNTIFEEGGVAVGSTIVLTHFFYSRFSYKCVTIKVVSKYTYSSYGFTNFMVVDSHGKHYRVNNSLWYNKWDSIE